MHRPTTHLRYRPPLRAAGLARLPAHERRARAAAGAVAIALLCATIAPAGAEPAPGARASAIPAAAATSAPPAAAPAAAALPAAATAAAAEPPTAYARVLAKHVRPGTVSGIRLSLVDYGALATDPDYAQALRDLESADPGSLPTEADRLAFWINAYNLLAIKTVVDRYPIDSIRDGGSLISPIWKKRVGTVAGREFSLDDVEHGILRAKFSEPRIHFAIVCASLSCPDLRREPYVGERLDAQLGEQTRAFLANPQKGLAPGPHGRKARVSSIFRWFRGDFDAAGGVAAFVRTSADPAVAAKIPELTDAGITYLDYDWSLNDAHRAAP